MKISSIRMNLLEGGKFLASASICVDKAIARPGIRLGKRDDGAYYILMPAIRRRDNTFRETFFPISSEARAELTDAIVTHYENVLSNDTLNGQVVAFEGSYEFNITEVRVTRIEDESSFAKGIASVTVDNALALRGMRIVKRDGGYGLLMPSYRREPREGEEKPTYIDTYHPISNEVRNALTEAILEEFGVSAPASVEE